MFVKLIEEIVDIKVKQLEARKLHVKPEYLPMMEERRHSENRRLELVRQELVRILAGAEN